MALIWRYEAEAAPRPRASSLAKLQTAFEAAGVEIQSLPRPGARLRLPFEWLSAVRGWASEVSRVERVWVFGSYGRGEANKGSDLDLAYTLSEEGDCNALAFAMFEGPDWQSRLEREIGIPIDLQLAQPDDVVVWPAVLREGVQVYERR